MKLFAVVIFLSCTTTVSSLRAVAGQPPGILVRLTDKGLQYVAKKIMEWVDSKIDPGLRFPNIKGSYEPSIGSVAYLMTEVQAKNFNWLDVSGTIIPGVGVKASFHKISVSINGRFNFNYTVMFIPTSSSGTFSLTLSDVSLNVDATAGMTANGLPTVDFPSCSASIGNIELEFKADSMKWILDHFTANIKNTIKPTLIDAICKPVRDGRNLIVSQIANNIKPCLDRSCFFLIDLHFTSAPVFGKGFIETALHGEIFWKSDARRAPFTAPPFQRLPVSPKMTDVYVNAYVVNTLLFALHQNDLLSYEFTKNDLPLDYQNVMNTSCPGICIGKILPDIFSRYPGAAVGLEAVATKIPFLNIFENNVFSLAFAGNVNIHIRNSTGSVTALGVLALEGTVVGSALTSSDGKFVFSINRIVLTNASLSDNEAKGNRDVAEPLRSAVTNYLLPKLNELGQKGFSVLSLGKLSASSPTLKLIQNTFVLMTDVIYSSAPTAA